MHYRRFLTVVLVGFLMEFAAWPSEPKQRTRKPKKPADSPGVARAADGTIVSIIVDGQVVAINPEAGSRPAPIVAPTGLAEKDVTRDQDGRITSIFWMGQRITIKPEVGRRVPPHQPADAWYHVDDPSKGPNTRFPNPPGADQVRTVLGRLQPTPADRVAYFAVLDEDPLIDQVTHNGWWLLVDRVELRPDGWIAEVMARPKFLPGNTGPSVSAYWRERYQYRNGTLHYLDGQIGSDRYRVPRISLWRP
jgi:hypothetical protein